MSPQPIYLDADPVRLAQVFSNLLNNAAKYMDRGGHIWLTSTRGEREVVVTVRDAGIGIPAEALPAIFDMFTQVDRSLEKSQGGLGIGLTLVKQLVEMHGGNGRGPKRGPRQGGRVHRSPSDGFRRASAGSPRTMHGEDAPTRARAASWSRTTTAMRRRA